MAELPDTNRDPEFDDLNASAKRSLVDPTGGLNDHRFFLTRWARNLGTSAATRLATTYQNGARNPEGEKDSFIKGLAHVAWESVLKPALTYPLFGAALPFYGLYQLTQRDHHRTAEVLSRGQEFMQQLPSSNPFGLSELALYEVKAQIKQDFHNKFLPVSEEQRTNHASVKAYREDELEITQEQFFKDQATIKEKTLASIEELNSRLAQTTDPEKANEIITNFRANLGGRLARDLSDDSRNDARIIDLIKDTENAINHKVTRPCQNRVTSLNKHLAKGKDSAAKEALKTQFLLAMRLSALMGARDQNIGTVQEALREHSKTIDAELQQKYGANYSVTSKENGAGFTIQFKMHGLTSANKNDAGAQTSKMTSLLYDKIIHLYATCENPPPELEFDFQPADSKISMEMAIIAQQICQDLKIPSKNISFAENSAKGGASKGLDIFNAQQEKNINFALNTQATAAIYQTKNTTKAIDTTLPKLENLLKNQNPPTPAELNSELDNLSSQVRTLEEQMATLGKLTGQVKGAYPTLPPGGGLRTLCTENFDTARAKLVAIAEKLEDTTLLQQGDGTAHASQDRLNKLKESVTSTLSQYPEAAPTNERPHH